MVLSSQYGHCDSSAGSLGAAGCQPSYEAHCLKPWFHLKIDFVKRILQYFKICFTLTWNV